MPITWMDRHMTKCWISMNVIMSFCAICLRCIRFSCSTLNTSVCLVRCSVRSWIFVTGLRLASQFHICLKLWKIPWDNSVTNHCGSFTICRLLYPSFNYSYNIDGRYWVCLLHLERLSLALGQWNDSVGLSPNSGCVTSFMHGSAPPSASAWNIGSISSPFTPT